MLIQKRGVFAQQKHTPRDDHEMKYLKAVGVHQDGKTKVAELISPLHMKKPNTERCAKKTDL